MPAVPWWAVAPGSGSVTQWVFAFSAGLEQNAKRLPWGWGAKPSSSFWPKLSALRTPRLRWDGRARSASSVAPDFTFGTCCSCPWTAAGLAGVPWVLLGWVQGLSPCQTPAPPPASACGSPGTRGQAVTERPLTVAEEGFC